MITPEVSYTAVAIQNSSEWPCSMCPFLQLRLVGVRTSYIYIFFLLIFPGHLEFWTPLQIPSWGPPLVCTLFHLPLTCLVRGTGPTTQACALTGNRTSDPLVCRRELSLLSHTSQGKNE